MSCFVMVRRASRPIPFRPAGAPSPVPAGSCRAAGLPGPSFGGSVLPHSECRSFIPFRSVSFPSPRRRPARQAGPFSARIAGAGGRASAPARFARLIAPARASPGTGRTSPVRFSGAFFRAGANRKARRPRGCRLVSRPLIWLSAAGGQAPIENYFQNSRTQCRFHPGGVAVRPELPSDPAPARPGPVERAAIRQRTIRRTNRGA